jgi:hypothetical protein
MISILWILLTFGIGFVIGRYLDELRVFIALIRQKEIKSKQVKQ